MSNASIQNRGRDPRGPLIGYAIGLTNPKFGIDLFSSPHEILEDLESLNLSFRVLAGLDETGISSTEIYKAAPTMEVFGGESADGIMDLLDATEDSDLRSYERILRRNHQFLRDPKNAVVLLLAAIWASRTDIARLLIKEGVSTQPSTHLGMTPLHWAAALGEPSITAELLSSAAQPSVFNWFLITPLELAHLNKCTAVVPLLLAKSNSTSRALASFSARTVLDRMCEVGR